MILKIFSWLTVVAILLVLPATMSRSGWLAAAIGCAVVLAIRYHIRPKRWQIVTTVVAGLIALAGIYLLKKKSADGRLLIWKLSIQTMLQHPAGVGWGRFAPALGNTQAMYFAAGKGTPQEEYVAGSPEFAFNEFLHIGVELGILAMMIFLAMIVVVGWLLFKQKQWGWLGVLVAFIVFASFSYPLHSLSFNQNLYMQFEQAKNYTQNGLYKESNELLEQLMQQNCDPMFYNVMGKNYQALKQYDKAESMFKHASNLVPHRIYPHYLLTLLYKETGQTEKMKRAAEVVLTKEPKVQSTAVKEMKEKVQLLLGNN